MTIFFADDPDTFFFYEDVDVIRMENEGAIPAPPPSGSNSVMPQRTRSLFPETWIWQTVKMGYIYEIKIDNWFRKI